MTQEPLMADATQADATQNVLEPETLAFYRRTMTLLEGAGLPFLVGGAYALTHYTEIERHTKDLDLFVLPKDVERVLEALARAGYYEVELTFPHWLGKAWQGEDFIDLIFSSRNGVATVDERWFKHAPEGKALGVAVKLCPAEEMLWSKGLIMERERYDGADVAHILRASATALDWPRLLSRFGPHWRVLLSHLILFGFIYPAERDGVPEWVMEELLGRLQGELKSPPPRNRILQGTILSGTQYGIDVERWGYEDALQGLEDGSESSSGSS